jgi:hypothetical protein
MTRVVLSAAKDPPCETGRSLAQFTLSDEGGFFASLGRTVRRAYDDNGLICVEYLA